MRKVLGFECRYSPRHRASPGGVPRPYYCTVDLVFTGGGEGGQGGATERTVQREERGGDGIVWILPWQATKSTGNPLLHTYHAPAMASMASYIRLEGRGGGRVQRGELVIRFPRAVLRMESMERKRRRRRRRRRRRDSHRRKVGRKEKERGR